MHAGLRLETIDGETVSAVFIKSEATGCCDLLLEWVDLAGEDHSLTIQDRTVEELRDFLSEHVK